MIDYPVCGKEPELLALWSAAFGEEDFWNHFLMDVFRTDHCRCVCVEGKIAAALYWFDCEFNDKKLAYIYAVATDKCFRNQGLCRKLLEDTHALLRRLGYAAAMLVPEGARLRKMYAGMGYTDCGTVHTFTCEAGEETSVLRRIDGVEYGLCRRKMLPRGSVLQEGDNLTHLAAMAELWAGDGMLLAAYRCGQILHVQEYLGDASAASGIVKALGCTRGVFRMPGGREPFAMVYPLDMGIAPPAYFGLAFD